MKLARSSAHAWGLFAAEHIGPMQFVIEYIGERMRSVLADKREAQYQSRCRSRLLESQREESMHSME